MDRKLQRHRADSLRQHGFLVTYLLHLFYLHTSCTLTIDIVSRPTAMYTVWSQSTNIKLSSDDEWNHVDCCCSCEGDFHILHYVQHGLDGIEQFQLHATHNYR